VLRMGSNGHQGDAGGQENCTFHVGLFVFGSANLRLSTSGSVPRVPRSVHDRW
jgi:hypothetical protein